jgi:DNA-binding transcriptional LysR family regulator
MVIPLNDRIEELDLTEAKPSSMPRQSLDDLVAFLAVARAGNFTHAAPDLGVSQSALSHTIRVLGTPSYFAKRPPRRTSQDLAQHDCINMRFPTHRELLLREFDRQGQSVNVRVEGQWVFSSSAPMLRAALTGFGLAYLPEDMVLEHVEAGRLLRILEDWCGPFTGYYLYYASRRQSSRALAVVIEALRHRG